MYAPFYVLYQEDSIDGFTAAWLLWKKFEGVARFVPCSLQCPLTAQIENRHLLFVGFTYPCTEMERIASVAKSVLMLDYRATSVREFIDFYSEDTSKLTLQSVEAFLNKKRGGMYGVFDRNHCGCTLAHRFCGSESGGDLCAYIEDNVLGAYVLPHTHEVYAAVTSYEFDFEVWSQLGQMRVNPPNDIYMHLVMEGETLLRKQARDLRLNMVASTRTMEIGGHMVKVVNSAPSMAALIAEELDKDGAFGAVYHDNVYGRMFTLRRKMDFRPDPVDVSKIAQVYGGRGTDTQAVFTVKYEDAVIYPELFK